MWVWPRAEQNLDPPLIANYKPLPSGGLTFCQGLLSSLSMKGALQPKLGLELWAAADRSPEERQRSTGMTHSVAIWLPCTLTGLIHDNMDVFITQYWLASFVKLKQGSAWVEHLECHNQGFYFVPKVPKWSQVFKLLIYGVANALETSLKKLSYVADR